MNVIVSKDLMLEGLKKVSHFIGKSGVFATVKIYVEDDEMTLSTTDSHSYANAAFETITTTQAGLAVIPFKDIFEFLKKVKANTVELETIDNHQLLLKSGNINYKMLDHSEADVFPGAPNEEMEFISLSADEYKEILNKTSYAVAKSESRPVLTGVNISTYDGGVRFVATDSHRLATYDLKQPLPVEINVSPSGKLLSKTLKVLNKNTKDVQLGFSERYTLLKFEGTEIYIRNMEGNYPDSSRLIPDSFATHISIDAKETIDTLNVLKSIAKSDRNNIVQMNLNGKIELSTTDGINTMSAVLNGEKQGDDMTVSYSLLFMTEALKAANESEVNINFCGSTRPFVIEDHNAISKHLILPIRPK